MSLVASDLVPKLRMYCYNPSQDLISDEQMTTLVQGWIDILGNDNKDLCSVLWNSLASILEYLWNTDTLNHNEITGGATQRLERVGEVQVNVRYGDSPNEYTSPWEDIYNNYLNGVLQIPGCARNGIADKVMIGGVSKKEINRVNHNPDSVNGLGGVSSVDRHTRNIRWDRSHYGAFLYKRGR